MKLSQKEFDRLRREIENEELVNENSVPVAYGVEHAIFEQEKYKRLIAVARKRHTLDARKQQQAWMRQLEYARRDQVRFQKLREDIRAERPDFLKCLTDLVPYCLSKT